MKLIVGLGNPGERYAGTRHNVGFHLLDRFAERSRIVFDGHEKDAFTARGRVAGRGLVLAKPQTYMNLSGRSVAALVRNYVDTPSDLLVVYDDIDLTLGRIRIRESGSAGSHNGMKSIVAELGTEVFPRLRFGIRPTDGIVKTDLADFVLDHFSAEEEPLVDDQTSRALDAILYFVRDDIRRAMSTFNREVVTEEVPAT